MAHVTGYLNHPKTAHHSESVRVQVWFFSMILALDIITYYYIILIYYYYILDWI